MGSQCARSRVRGLGSVGRVIKSRHWLCSFPCSVFGKMRRVCAYPTAYPTCPVLGLDVPAWQLPVWAYGKTWQLPICGHRDRDCKASWPGGGSRKQMASQFRPHMGTQLRQLGEGDEARRRQGIELGIQYAVLRLLNGVELANFLEVRPHIRGLVTGSHGE